MIKYGSNGYSLIACCQRILTKDAVSHIKKCEICLAAIARGEAKHFSKEDEQEANNSFETSEEDDGDVMSKFSEETRANLEKSAKSSRKFVEEDDRSGDEICNEEPEEKDDGDVEPEKIRSPKEKDIRRKETANARPKKMVSGSKTKDKNQETKIKRKTKKSVSKNYESENDNKLMSEEEDENEPEICVADDEYCALEEEVDKEETVNLKAGKKLKKPKIPKIPKIPNKSKKSFQCKYCTYQTNVKCNKTRHESNCKDRKVQALKILQKTVRQLKKKMAELEQEKADILDKYQRLKARRKK